MQKVQLSVLIGENLVTFTGVSGGKHKFQGRGFICITIDHVKISS